MRQEAGDSLLMAELWSWGCGSVGHVLHKQEDLSVGPQCLSHCASKSQARCVQKNTNKCWGS